MSAVNGNGNKRVLLAAPRSFCAGVDRAIDVVELALAQRGAPIYVRKQIVHNEHVVADLERRGAVFVQELDAVPDGATVVLSAHGVSPAVKDHAVGGVCRSRYRPVQHAGIDQPGLQSPCRSGRSRGHR